LRYGSVHFKQTRKLEPVKLEMTNEEVLKGGVLEPKDMEFDAIIAAEDFMLSSSIVIWQASISVLKSLAGLMPFSWQSDDDDWAWFGKVRF